MKRETRREEGRESYEYGKEESPHTVVLIMRAKNVGFCHCCSPLSHEIS